MSILKIIQDGSWGERCRIHDDPEDDCLKYPDTIGVTCFRSMNTCLASAKVRCTDYSSVYDEGVHRRQDLDKHVDVIYSVWESHKGRVVAYEVDYDVRVMSDVYDNVPYAVVVRNDGTFERVSLYEGPGYHESQGLARNLFPNHQLIDASPEEIARYEAHKVEVARLREERSREAYRARCAEIAEAEAKEPRKGRKCRVVRGRKVAVGTEGVSFWFGESRYGKRVGLQLANGERIFVDAKNVEAVGENK